jgi:hypothetical protein
MMLSFFISFSHLFISPCNRFISLLSASSTINYDLPITLELYLDFVVSVLRYVKKEPGPYKIVVPPVGSQASAREATPVTSTGISVVSF